MSTLGAILLILAGLAILNYGIFLFYAWLPVLYGLFGFEIGMLLGRSMTGDVGALAITLGDFCSAFRAVLRSGLRSHQCLGGIMAPAASSPLSLRSSAP
jgi:hypothetical protein